MNDLFLYKSVRDKMQDGDLIAWRSNHLIGQLISIFSKGTNHISTVTREPDVDRVFITEALGSGLQPRALSDRLSKHSGKAWWVPLKDEYWQFRKGIRKWLVKRWWTGYGYFELFQYLGNRPKANDKKMVCSEAAFLAAREAGISYLREVEHSPTPAEIISFDCYEEKVRIL